VSSIADFVDPADLTIQTFDDLKSRDDKSLAKIFPFDSKKIAVKQIRGAGVFFPVNPQENPFKRGVENTNQFA